MSLDLHIAVYAITKNEEHHVDRFLGPLRGKADSITIVDTGSEDGTYRKLASDPDVSTHQATISPWRFDDARNVSMAFVPPDADVCVCLDLDEVVQPGWDEAIRKAWTGDTTRLRYPFIWSWQPDGSPGVTYYADKIHKRHGYRWRGACHETLRLYRAQEVQTWTDDLVVHHHPDSSKPRSSYLELMAVAIEEDPNDDRMQHYYARELMYRTAYMQAAAMFKTHLANPRSTWRHERSQSMIYLATCEPDQAGHWLYRAAAECPERKEVWYELAKWEAGQGDSLNAVGFARRAMKIPVDRYYLSDPQAQGSGPAQLIAEVISSQSGMIDLEEV